MMFPEIIHTKCFRACCTRRDLDKRRSCQVTRSLSDEAASITRRRSGDVNEEKGLKTSFPHEPALNDFFLPVYLVKIKVNFFFFFAGFRMFEMLCCVGKEGTRERSASKVFLSSYRSLFVFLRVDTRANDEGMSYFITYDDDNDINKLFKESVDYGGKDKRFSLEEKKRCNIFEH